MVVRFVMKHSTLMKFNRSLKPQANTSLISTSNSEMFSLTSMTPPHTYSPLNLKPTLLSNSNLLNLYLFDKYLFKVLSLFHTWSLSQPFLTLSLVSSLKSSKSKTFLSNFKEYSLECYLLQKTLNVNNLSSSKNYEMNLNNQTVLSTINFF